MANGAYVGAASTARKIKKAYIGVSGVARNVKKMYIGVNGIARLCWQAGIPIADLPLGALVRFGRYQVESEAAQEVIWKIAAKGHISTPAYPGNSITLITDKIIDLRACDARESTSPISSVRTGGYNIYKLANIDQWLNKDSAAGAWYTAQHDYDQPPIAGLATHNTEYANKAGFLNLFTAAEKAALLNTNIRYVRPSSYDGGGAENITRKVFLAGAVETGLVTNAGDGSTFPIFTSGDADRIASLTAQAYNNTLSPSKPANVETAWRWLMRYPTVSSYTDMRQVLGSGALASGQPAAYGDFGIRPVCNISNSLLVSASPNADGSYTLLL